jgi:hypothetical protein
MPLWWKNMKKGEEEKGGGANVKEKINKGEGKGK